MAVVGSNITIDFHIVGETDVDTVRGAVREGEEVHSRLSNPLREAIENTADEVLGEHDITGYDLSLDLDAVNERVPGAPRERIEVLLDVEGDDSVLAAVDEAVGVPERADLADATEKILWEHLEREGITDHVDVTVIVTPVQFR